jgi:hypothetical protein
MVGKWMKFELAYIFQCELGHWLLGSLVALLAFFLILTTYRTLCSTLHRPCCLTGWGRPQGREGGFILCLALLLSFSLALASHILEDMYIGFV